MMDLYVYNEKIELQGILEGWTSVIWNRRYSEVGEFEIHCDFSEKLLELLKEDYIIWKNDSEEAGYIHHISLSQKENGDESIVILGEFAAGYLSRRIIWNRTNVKDTPENIMRKIVNENLINPVDTSRKINNILLGEINVADEKVEYQASYKNVLEEVEKLASANELGIRNRFDYETEKFVFEVYRGVDRTSDQSINPPAIFSQEFNNVIQQDYVSAINDYKNVALIAGEGEASDRKFENIGDAQGLNRHELFIDARDLQSTKEENEIEVTIPDAEYRQMLITRGKNKISEFKRTETFNSEVNLKSNLIYKKDFDLGDKVSSISNRWNVSVDERITEITEIYEADGLTIDVVFGKDEKGIIEKLKRDVV